MTVAPKGLVHCPPTACTEQERTLRAYIDAQQAEIQRLKAENAKLLSDVTRPESLDVGLMRAEIGRLNAELCGGTSATNAQLAATSTTEKP